WVRQSLLGVVEPRGGAEADPPRFSMLETIREFGLAQLAARDETEAVHRAHAEHFLALGERHALADFAPDGDRVLALLDAEHDNLRAALACLEAAAVPAAALRLS